MTSTTAPNVTVRVTAILQKLTDGQKAVEARGTTVGEILDDLESKHPGFKEKMLGEDGKLQRFVNVYLNDEDVRYTGGVDTEVREGDTLDILPALAGGAR